MCHAEAHGDDAASHPDEEAVPCPGGETERFAEAARFPGTAERAALVEIANATAEGTLSMSATLAALVEAGRRAAADQVLADSYAALAPARTEEDHAARVAMRGRVARRPGVA